MIVLFSHILNDMGKSLHMCTCLLCHIIFHGRSHIFAYLFFLFFFFLFFRKINIQLKGILSAVNDILWAKWTINQVPLGRTNEQKKNDLSLMQLSTPKNISDNKSKKYPFAAFILYLSDNIMFDVNYVSVTHLYFHFNLISALFRSGRVDSFPIYASLSFNLNDSMDFCFSFSSFHRSPWSCFDWFRFHPRYSQILQCPLQLKSTTT